VRQLLGNVDLSSYARAVVLLLANPVLALAPLLMAVAQVLLFRLLSLGDPSDGGVIGFATSGLAGLVSQLMNSFGLAVSLILAENIWRRGRAQFDVAWDEGRRKVGDILLAALGFNFILYVAALFGGFIPVFGAIVLSAIALYFFIYTVPAAAIGGIPGGAALQVSLERAQRSRGATFVVTIVYVLAFFVLPVAGSALALPLVLAVPAAFSGIVTSLAIAVLKSIAAGYVALVLSKAYDDASYGRRW
jgi:hypothetical protein